MLRRLLLGLLPLALGAAAIAAAPLAVVLADRATQQVYLDRLADADRFAMLADRALRDGRTRALADELHRYGEVFGIRAWLLTPDGAIVVDSGAGTLPPTITTNADVVLATRGVRPDPPGPVLPWTSHDLLVAEPVGQGSAVIGAVVTLSPTGHLHEAVLLRWSLLVAGALVFAGLLAAATIPFSHWLLRPIARLDGAVGEIAAGRLGSRVRLGGGPPELRRLATSFDQMADIVEETLHRQQQFVGDASHQLRTPLTSLRLAVDNLEPLLPDGAARAQHAEAVQEVAGMGRLLDDLLALTRLSGGPAREVADLDDLVTTAAARWRLRCADAGLTLVVDVERGCRALAPAGGLRHVIDELVENAVRLSGGSRINVGARLVSASVLLWVQDDGRGLDAAQREAATRRFWRAPEHQNTDGSGLGLAIVSELAVAAGGRLDLLDADPGLRVELTLPSPTGT